GEVIATPGSESNVKEIFDKTWELKKTRENVIAFNQFEEFGNHLWHYEVTGSAMQEVLKEVMGQDDRFSGVALTSGSAGTLGCGDYLKERYPNSKIAVGEALQCPTLLNNGFGAHRIEGIGDKHVPWIHNVKNTDLIIAVDDKDSMSLVRLFNEPAGQQFLKEKIGIKQDVIDNLDLMGISGVANMISAIKFAKYYELGKDDIILTVFTDSMELYQSRLEEMREKFGEYDKTDAKVDYYAHLQRLTTDYLEELTYQSKKRIHNLKYYTWVEQQGKDVKELNAQWYDYQNYWGNIHSMTGEIDKLIDKFNQKVGLLK
ncbi:MAG: pyridoxal-5-phosphate-dependent protein subunit beta, partial [Halanaerobiales bacterium]|nr:pyridoxal-5-phosphate-dependent protein subunit beta [Halanaerobiales bacterium]